MRTLLRRLLMLWLLMFWQGGFTFYAAVVVPIGTQVLGSPEEQGWITRRVTFWLNVAGAASLLAWGWDIVVQPDSRFRRARRFALWCVLVLLLTALAALHLRLEGLMDPERFRIVDRDSFRAMHRWYLNVSTAQWVGAVVLSWWTLQAWRPRTEPPVVS